MVTDFLRKGWLRLSFDQARADWAASVQGPALAALGDPQFSHWHVCEGTWFVGVDALDNDAEGRVGQGEPLPTAGLDAVIGPLPALHKGQVSAVFPGYPRPREGESAAAFRYRRDRDTAHVDGLHAVGPDRRRKILECHQFILGLPLIEADAEASPLVVWDGSHEIVRRHLRTALAGHPRENWPEVDVTDAYHAARREAFADCPRIALPARPGEATLVHRLALHGVAPWTSLSATPRVIAYFRPEIESGICDWLEQP